MCIIVVSAEWCGNIRHDLMAEHEFGNRGGNHLGRVDDTTIKSGDVDGLQLHVWMPLLLYREAFEADSGVGCSIHL
jgi:hypothetical protein